MTEPGNKPLVKNSLFNVTFEAEDSSPALIPVSIFENSSGNKEINSEIELNPPSSLTTIPRVPIKSAESEEEVTPISLFGKYTNECSTSSGASNSALFVERKTGELFKSSDLSGSNNFWPNQTPPASASVIFNSNSQPVLTTQQLNQKLTPSTSSVSLDSFGQPAHLPPAYDHPPCTSSTHASIPYTPPSHAPPIYTPPSNIPTSYTPPNVPTFYTPPVNPPPSYTPRATYGAPPPYYSTNDYYANHATPSSSSANTYFVPTTTTDLLSPESVEAAFQNQPRPQENPMFPGPPPPQIAAPSENAYRLNNQRPVYAKYPGLSSELQGQYSSGPHTMPNAPNSNARPTLHNLAPSFFAPQDTGPGYSFGAPMPSHSCPRLHPAVYNPIVFHWFYRIEIEGRLIWKPFSLVDSAALEAGYASRSEALVPTDGSRFDVNIQKRLKMAVYWEEDAPSEIRRASWFYKGPMDSRYVPYDEEFAKSLEEAYERATITGEWHKRLDLGGGEAIILQNANSIVHFCQAASPDEWGNLPESQLRPRVVKRGVEDFEIEIGEQTQVDYLVFFVHGIGAICDFKFRSIVEAVDDFRGLSSQMMQNHFRESIVAGRAGRVEFLPVSWHKALHTDGGIDRKLKPITLPSIPKLRHFTNDTLLDILFYTSPVYCQTIVDTVAREMNRMYNLFLERNKTFEGRVALSGHSLGSVILFDLLAHQPKPSNKKTDITMPDNSELSETTEATQDLQKQLCETLSECNLLSRTPSYTVTPGGTGQPFINYPVLDFYPAAFFAMGSPTGMFVTVRGLDELGPNFCFPTCPGYFNIFHPYDPVAYRMEGLIDQTVELPPEQIAHHKGRKRFHLELKDTVTRVSADLKNKFIESIRTTWNTVSQLRNFGRTEVPIGETGDGNSSHSGHPPTAQHLVNEWAYCEVNRINSAQTVSGQVMPDIQTVQNQTVQNQTVQNQTVQNQTVQNQTVQNQTRYFGVLNRGRRIDYVLQEAPVEILNEYLFALTSHVCYWESEDVSLFLLKELYATLDIAEDNEERSHSPVSSLTTNESMGLSTSSTFEAHPPPLMMPPIVCSSDVPGPSVKKTPYIPFPDTPNNLTGAVNGSHVYGMDPTAPINTSASIGPPPLAGFFRKS